MLAAAAVLPSDIQAQRFGDDAVPVACRTTSYRRTSRVVAGTVFVGGNIALYEYFRRSWWAGEKADFFVKDDWDLDFRDQDKFGHAWGGYWLTRAGTWLLQGSCVSPRKAVVMAAAYATLFQLQIEYWDGFQEEYGFSFPDLLTNAVGAGYATAQVFVKPLRHVTPTVSYARTAALKADHGDLRRTVDYSGQTYWLSADVEAMLPPAAKRWWPGILRASIGHSITDWVDPVTGTQMRADRKLVLSLDLDPRRLPGNHPAWKLTKDILAHYRWPAPALVVTPKAEFVLWYR